MKTKLQEMRTAAGFKSAREFAEHLGMSVGTYTQYEQGYRNFSLEKAWEFADALHCTLDELAGREWPRSEMGPAQRELNECWDACTTQQRVMLLMTAQNAALASGGAAGRAADGAAAVGA